MEWTKMVTNGIDLKKHIREFPDWPKKGILFYDITPILHKPKVFAAAVDALCSGFIEDNIDCVAAVEARGFIFGISVAQKLGVGFIPIRKKGKLPGQTESVSYNLEYGTDTLEVQRDAIEGDRKVLIIDDLLATGGTVASACELIEKIGGKVAGISFLVELTELKGKDKLSGYKIQSVISY